MGALTTFGIVKLTMKLGIALGVVYLVSAGLNKFNKSNFTFKKGGASDDSDVETTKPLR